MQELMDDISRLKRILKSIGIANSVIDITVTAIIVLLIMLSAYALTDINRVVVDGAPEQYAIYNPRVDYGSYEELVALNPEVIGWINMYGTKIDYPITQADNNDKYLSYSPKLEYSLLGSIFLDYRNKPDFSDFCSILYGHNMTPRAMFGNVKDYLDKAYFDAHLYGDIFYGGKHHGLEAFAIFEEDGYSSFYGQLIFAPDESKEDYLAQIMEKSVITRDIGVSTEDNIVLLYTCSNAATNGRQLLACRITDKTFVNPYEQESSAGSFDRLKQIPIWVWFFLLLLILLAIWYYIKRKDEKARKERELSIKGSEADAQD